MSESYPYIKLNYEGLRYVEINSSLDFTVTLHTDEDTSADITSLSTVLCLDKNCIKIDDTLNFKFEGTSSVKVLYEHEGEMLKYVEEFVVYETFFRDNYLQYIWHDFERENIQANKKQKIMWDTLMEFFDILWAHKADIVSIRNPIKTKEKFLNELGVNLGFERLDFEYEDTAFETASNEIYRELLLNIGNLLAIRGTYLIYELFFAVLGYDIKINEYWYNEDGELIEMDHEDDSLNTYYAYDTLGNPLDDPQIPRKDPRKNISSTNDYNKNNKSNFIQVVLSQKENINSDIVKDPIEFSLQRKQLIQSYLDFLKPLHIQYLVEKLMIGISEETLSMFSSIDELISFVLFKYFDFGSGDPRDSWSPILDPGDPPEIPPTYDTSIVYPPDPGFTNPWIPGEDYEVGHGLGPWTGIGGGYNENLFSGLFNNFIEQIKAANTEYISESSGYEIFWDTNISWDDGTYWDERSLISESISFVEV